MNTDNEIVLLKLLDSRIYRAEEITRDHIKKNIRMFFTKTSPDESSGLAKLINEVKK